MGYIKHHAIIVTGWRDEELKEAQQKAKEIFEKNFESDPYEKPLAGKLVSDIIQGIVNGYSSFFIAPDGSKEGWAISNNADAARKEFINWLRETDTYLDYVEIVFGGDDEYERFLHSRNTNLDEEDPN
jgi:hypothetical protein